MCRGRSRSHQQAIAKFQPLGVQFKLERRAIIGYRKSGCRWKNLWRDREPGVNETLMAWEDAAEKGRAGSQAGWVGAYQRVLLKETSDIKINDYAWLRHGKGGIIGGAMSSLGAAECLSSVLFFTRSQRSEIYRGGAVGLLFVVFVLFIYYIYIMYVFHSCTASGLRTDLSNTQLDRICVPQPWRRRRADCPV